VTRHPEQAAAVAAIAADVVALQEVTPRTWPMWREVLGPGALWSLDGLETHGGPRPLGVVLAAMFELERVPLGDVAWPERALHARGGGADWICAHSPISPSRELAKVRFHEGLLAHLQSVRAPAVLAGDLNTPRREHPDGTLLTFAHNSDGSLRPDRGERWDAAEQALLRTLGWTDAFRAPHPGEKARSWTWPNGGGYRLDHVLVTPDVRVEGAEYLHELRTSGLSDHSGLLVELDLRETTDASGG
jgi:endonuclease/exonuclease/phosphatase family metal-dependent hydrolase